MNCHFYYSLSGALLCLMLANSPCLADGSTTTSTTAPAAGPASSSGYDYGSAAPGKGASTFTGEQPEVGYGNSNVPFSEWVGTTNQNPDPAANGDPYDKIPINQVNTVDGQQILDHDPNPANPYVGNITQHTWQQIPNGRNWVGAGGDGTLGLPHATTAIQAGISYGYTFTQTDPGKYPMTYGFDKPVNKAYLGSNYIAPNQPTPVSNRLILPPTSTGSVWLDNVDLNPMPLQ